MRKATYVLVFAALMVAAGCGGYGSSSGDDSVTVQLNEQNGSGESGTATLTKSGNDRTKVVIALAHSPAEPQPAHIHKGSCDNLDPTPEYPLQSVANGSSATTVAASLKSLEDNSFAVNVHKSASDLQTYIACGDIGSGSDGGGGGSGY